MHLVTVSEGNFSHNQAMVHISLHKPTTAAAIVTITTAATTQTWTTVTVVAEAKEETHISDPKFCLPKNGFVGHSYF